MNLLVRLIRVLISSLFRTRLDILDVSMVSFRVWPNDLDFNGHMNNGRYLTLMDLGRIDLILRVGLGKYVLTGKWMPIVASAKIRFRRSLGPFKKYQLHTRLLCWDDKWFIVEQRFMVKDRSVAIAYVKALFRDRNGNIAPSDVLLTLGHNSPSPPMPESVQLWLEAEGHMETD
jgi:acyl-CoA thioesterase FadM